MRPARVFRLGRSILVGLALALALAIPCAAATPSFLALEGDVTLPCAGLESRVPIIIVRDVQLHRDSACNLAVITLSAPSIAITEHATLNGGAATSHVPLLATHGCGPSHPEQGLSGRLPPTLVLAAATVDIRGSVVGATGGAGQDVLVEVPSCGVGQHTAAGGDGAPGGNVVIEAVHRSVTGYLEQGVGGRGGDARVLPANDTMRGENGTPLAPTGEDATVDPHNGTADDPDGWSAFAFGGNGAVGAPGSGRGGHATAFAGAGRDGRLAESGAGESRAGDGGNAEAYGGAGAPGFGGGAGGDAKSVAGDGGQGDDAYDGPQGQDGGSSGHSLALGGAGGAGVFRSGNGGRANATGARAGDGGAGYRGDGIGGAGGFGGETNATAGAAGDLSPAGLVPGPTVIPGNGGSALARGGFGGAGGDAVSSPGAGGAGGKTTSRGGPGGSGIDGGAGGNAGALGGSPGPRGEYVQPRSRPVENTPSENAPLPLDAGQNANAREAPNSAPLLAFVVVLALCALRRRQA